MSVNTGNSSVVGSSDEYRRSKILALKKSIATKYGASFLPLSSDQLTLETIRKDDSAEIKKQKYETNQQVMSERAAEAVRREPELLAELNKIVERVRAARAEYGDIKNLYASTAAPHVEAQFVCEHCGNKDPNFLITDPLRGESVCMGRNGGGCGTVVRDHMVDQGAEKRNFEGEEDRNHFGAAPNKLMPDVVNMATALNTMSRNGRDNSSWKRLSQTHQAVEMNISTIGRDERHTREGYKTNQKRRAFALMEEIAANVNVHQLVVQKAKEEFTKYRDVREAVHQFEGTVAACLVLAYEELSASMHLDELSRSRAVGRVVRDVGALPGSDFARKLRPRAEVVEDAAICTVPQLPLGRFSAEQAREWLLAVATGSSSSSSTGEQSTAQTYTSEAEEVCSHLVQLLAAPAAAEVIRTTGGGQGSIASTGRRYPKEQSSIFGTVTASSRLSRFKAGALRGASSATRSGSGNSSCVGSGTDRPRSGSLTSNHSNDNVSNTSGNATTDAHGTSTGATSAGHHLLRLNFALVLRTAHGDGIAEKSSQRQAAARIFHDAVVRRGQYDVQLAEVERTRGLQHKRLRTEDRDASATHAELLRAVAAGVACGKSTSVLRPESEGPLEMGGGQLHPNVNQSDVVISTTDENFDLEDLVGGCIATVDKYSKPVLKSSADVPPPKPVAVQPAPPARKQHSVEELLALSAQRRTAGRNIHAHADDDNDSDNDNQDREKGSGSNGTSSSGSSHSLIEGTERVASLASRELSVVVNEQTAATAVRHDVHQASSQQAKKPGKKPRKRHFSVVS